MPARFKVRTIAFAALPSLLLLAGCGEVPSEASHEGLHADVQRNGVAVPTKLVKSVRAATARFHATAEATHRGYAEASPCVAHPTLGGMGFHWVNGALVDPVFDPLKPEAVLYVPDANGKLRLVAVEYIVINVGQPAPTFGGQPFDVGGTPVPVAHWSLHVWAHYDNPSGIFSPFNPRVVCPSAPDA